MMNHNACLSLGHEMADAVLSGDDRVAKIKAADFLAAWSERQPVAPWTPWNQRASIVAHSPGCAE